MKLTKEMLIDWIDRPPSNGDLDLIAKILNLQIELEVTNEIITMNINRINKLENENQQLKKQKDDVAQYIKKHIQRYDVDGSPTNLDEFDFLASPKILLRMLGEIDD